jgi:hypothetical protein
VKKSTVSIELMSNASCFLSYTHLPETWRNIVLTYHHTSNWDVFEKLKLGEESREKTHTQASEPQCYLADLIVGKWFGTSHQIEIHPVAFNHL